MTTDTLIAEPRISTETVREHGLNAEEYQRILNALGREPIARLTTDEIDSVADSPYNTYRQKGLPPGPIEAPGDAAIDAAANPADGPWFFYVTVNLRTGETKFTDDYDEFLGFKRERDEYCATQSDRC